MRRLILNETVVRLQFERISVVTVIQEKRVGGGAKNSFNIFVVVLEIHVVEPIIIGDWRLNKMR